MRFIFKTDYAQDLQIVKHSGQAFWYGLLVLAMLAAPLWAGDYWLSQISFVLIYAVADLGLMVLSGFTGLASIGHAAFLGVGAYVQAVLSAKGWPFPLTMALAAGLSAAVGAVVGLPALRVKGIYLAIATLSFGFIVEEVLARWESVTKGNAGMSVTSPQFVGADLGSSEAFYYIALGTTVLVTLGVLNLLRSATGRAFIAIRDNDRAAEGMGIPIFRYKLLSFAISSFYAGFAGAIWAYYMRSISTEPFTLGLSVEYIAMVIIGGLGSIPGAIFGAIFITGLNEILRFATDAMMNIGAFAGFGLNVASLREFAFGLAIVLFILFEPKGLAELWRIVRSSFRLWPFSY